ncbi:MAG: hypothetical protein F4103_08875 [Boseongicola sp. SB0673_bin_14]|nr:hypothetical protein [Boseongicola sp. SB0673_bin_14]
MFNNKTGMFSISRAETQFHIEKLVVNMAQANADEPMPDTTTRVAFHDIFRKRLVVGTKAGPVTIDLAGRLADQERTVDHTLAAFQKNKMLAPLEDKSGDQEG